MLVRSDGVQAYANIELSRNHGYHVKPVFGDPKGKTSGNLARWMISGRFKILSKNTMLIAQFKNLKRNAQGKQIKKNLPGEKGDHGPDAVRFATAAHDYTKRVEKEQQAALEAVVPDPEPTEVPRRIVHGGGPRVGGSFVDRLIR